MPIFVFNNYVSFSQMTMKSLGFKKRNEMPRLTEREKKNETSRFLYDLQIHGPLFHSSYSNQVSSLKQKHSTFIFILLSCKSFNKLPLVQDQIQFLQSLTQNSLIQLQQVFPTSPFFTSLNSPSVLQLGSLCSKSSSCFRRW